MIDRQRTVWEEEMLKKFPKGSFARIKPSYSGRRAGHLVQILEALAGMRMKVLVKPLKTKRAHKNHVTVEFRFLESVSPLEVLAEATK